MSKALNKRCPRTGAVPGFLMGGRGRGGGVRKKCIFPLLLLLRYVRAEMNVHAFMNELDQKDLISKKNLKL